MALIDVIKYEGGNDTLVWKHPREDFNSEAQMIVHESQEAVVIKDGQASNVYGAGKYTIQSDNIPGIKGIIGLVTGGTSPNHCEVYFVNKSYSMNVYWGTATPMIIQDPVWQVPFRVRAHGQFSIRVEDTKKFLLKIVGTTSLFTQRILSEQFRGLLMSRIKDIISNQMVQQEKSFMEINSYLTSISENVKDKVSDVFAGYGLELEEFYTESINVVEDDVYNKVREAMAERAKRMMEGYDYVTERSFDVAGVQAGNPGTSGGVAGIGIGMGVGASVGPVFAGMMNKSLQPVSNAVNSVPMNATNTRTTEFGVIKPKKNNISCKYCGNELAENDKFCAKCGKQVRGELTCSKCGVVISSDAAFCSKCGSKVGGEDNEDK